MHTLHATLTTPANPINAAKGIRAATLAAGQPLSMAEAALVVQNIEREGIVRLADHPDEKVADQAQQEGIRAASGALRIFKDATDEQVEKFKAELPKLKPVEGGKQPPRPEPSNIAHRVAIQFMAMTNGNPLVAAAHANRMGTVSEEPQFFAEVVAALVLTFPWIESKIEELV